MIKKRVALAMIGAMWSALSLADWTPPADPDPSQILISSQTDTRNGHYQDALSKLIWYRNESLRINPNLYGVRNSFALAYWKNLADVYPPALDELKRFRDKAADDTRADHDGRAAFMDAQSINDVLKDDASTIALFHWLDANKPDLAARVYDLAERTLVKAHEYGLCGKYLRPEESLKHYIDQLRSGLEYERNDAPPGAEPFAKPFFANRVARLVGLLVLNGKPDLAAQIAASGKAELKDKKYEGDIDAALKGSVPAAWPAG